MPFHHLRGSWCVGEVGFSLFGIDLGHDPSNSKYRPLDSDMTPAYPGYIREPSTFSPGGSPSTPIQSLYPVVTRTCSRSHFE